jgi:pimeloyl-ACP methyl ester carboxylesterase
MTAPAPPAPTPASPREAVPPARPERVRAGQATFAVTRCGEAGPWVVLLHGLPGDRHAFDEVARLLSTRARVLAPDLLGFGESDPAPPGTHAAGQAARLEPLLDALGADPIHLVGFDYGGPTAVHLAARRPGRVASLLLAATNLFPDTPVPAPLRLARVPVLGEALFAAMFSRPGLAAMWRGATGDRSAYPYRSFRRHHGWPGGLRSARHVFLQSLRDLAGLYGPVAEAAARLGRPSMVLWGDRDPFFPVDVARRTASHLGAPLRLLPGCGHFVPEERPAAVADGVLELMGRGR